MPLSDADVENSKPSDKPIKLYDRAGLFLLIHPRGGKWWRFKYRIQGREKQISLGTYPKVSLTMARSLRDHARQQLKKGLDPSALKQAEKVERKQAAESSNPSVRFLMDGSIEIQKGFKVMNLSPEEARFVADKLMEVYHASF